MRLITPPATPPGTPPARPPGAGDQAPAASVALSVLSVVAAAGMGRLFDDGSYLGPVITAALVSHATCWLARRLAWPLWAAALASVGAVTLSVVWIVVPETTAYGIPWTTTVETAREELAAAARLFGEVVAPAPVTKGFLIAGMGGAGTLSFLADWAAFRVGARWEAAVPSFGLFLFTALLGTSQHRALHVGAYLACLIAFVLVQEATLGSARASWFATRAQPGPVRWWQAGAGLGSLAILAGLVVGPLLPAGDGSARAGRSARSAGKRVTVSPLVDIRGRVVDRSPTEVFTVRADQRAYWRLTSLDTFDGSIWSSDSDYGPVDERLPGPTGRGQAGPAEADGASGARVVQEFEIRSLSSIWLPAAYRPVVIEGVRDARYDPQLGALVTGRSTTDGISYTVESVLARPTAGELSDTTGPPSGGGQGRFLQLPRLSPRVQRLAQEVAGAGAGPSPFARALALQDFFQRGFTYDLGARPGHDDGALEQFLFRSRRGYCEQFAGAYAVMARSVGLPTRVAVGFTPGELGPDGRYHVRSLHAHAWPEVFLDGFGWVAFEPTPGRGAPGAAYTGLPESQARLDDPESAVTPAQPPEPVQPPTTAPSPVEPIPSPPGEVAAEGGVPYVLLLVPGALCAPVAVVLVAKRLRRSRRRARATTAQARVMVAWLEAAEALAAAGVARQESETLSEYAPRAASAASLGPGPTTALATLARETTTASYAPWTLPAQVVTAAIAASAEVETELGRSTPAVRRLWRALDPRPLVRLRRV